MPRYFFNVHDGCMAPDDTGTDLPDLNAARTEAVKLAGALLNDGTEIFLGCLNWSMDVKDKAGSVLFSLRFTAS